MAISTNNSRYSATRRDALIVECPDLRRMFWTLTDAWLWYLEERNVGEHIRIGERASDLQAVITMFDLRYQGLAIRIGPNTSVKRAMVLVYLIQSRWLSLAPQDDLEDEARELERPVSGSLEAAG